MTVLQRQPFRGAPPYLRYFYQAEREEKERKRKEKGHRDSNMQVKEVEGKVELRVILDI